MRRTPAQTSGLFVVIAVIIAMASTGFAHRFVSQPLDPALTAYVAAGGSLADICGQTDGSSHHSLQSCEACQLVNAAVVPSHDPACDAPFGLLSAVHASKADLYFQSATFDMSRAPRAPPVV
ncbi:hypothetical protein [Loktanella sp. R86503]|uniref:hypothetical protein n=1 Tax=Loktanella sp. R86503 TaxID=3093847 RepID=UPI0036DB83CF